MPNQTLTDPANDLKMANRSSALTAKLLLGSNQDKLQNATSGYHLHELGGSYISSLPHQHAFNTSYTLNTLYSPSMTFCLLEIFRQSVL